MEEPFAPVAERIAGRTVAVVCQGPSAPFVKEVGRENWCYVSINRARLIEDLCPSPIEVVYCVSELRLKQEAAWLDKFPGIIISAGNADGLLHRPFIHLLEGEKQGFGEVNTLSVFLFFLMKAEVADILIFGCDGTGNTYYRAEEYTQKELNGTVLNDSMVMNERFWKAAKVVAPEWKGSIKLAGPTAGFSKVTCFPTVDAEGLNKIYPPASVPKT